MQVIGHGKVFNTQCLMIESDIPQFGTSAVAGVVRVNVQILFDFHIIPSG